MRLALGLIAGALVLAGCASSPREGAPPAGPPNLFLSPNGEPFRRGPQGADPIDAWFVGADSDRDGRLTSAEFSADAMRFFGLLDQNGDDRIDAFESQRYEREIVPEFGMDPFGPRTAAFERPESRPEGVEDDIIRLPERGLPPPRGRRGGRGDERGGAGWTGRIASLTGDPQPVRAADADLSQSVTTAEYATLSQRRFAALDTDRDGALARIELPPAKPLVDAGMTAPRGRGPQSR